MDICWIFCIVVLYTFLICCSISASFESLGCWGYCCFLDWICSSILSFCCAMRSCSCLLQGFSQYSWEQGCFFLFHPLQQTQGRDINPTTQLSILATYLASRRIFYTLYELPWLLSVALPPGQGLKFPAWEHFRCLSTQESKSYFFKLTAFTVTHFKWVGNCTPL